MVDVSGWLYGSACDKLLLLKPLKGGKVSELRNSLFFSTVHLNESFNHCSVETIKNNVERDEVSKD